MRSRAARVAAIGALMWVASMHDPVSAADPALASYERLAKSSDARRLLAVARTAIEDHWREQAPSAAHGFSDTAAVPDWPAAPAGVFVTLIRGRETRACVGTPVPTRGSLAETIRSLAVLSLSADRRRPPVSRDEITELRIAISFTDQGDPVADPMLVNPARDGLLVTSPRGSVAFLPGEARTIGWALREARRAGVLVAPDRAVSYRRLHAVTLSEPPARARTERAADDAP